MHNSRFRPPGRTCAKCERGCESDRACDEPAGPPAANGPGRADMKGTVRKRGSAWSYQFSIGTRDHRRHGSKGGFRTRRECEATALTEKDLGQGLGESGQCRRERRDAFGREVIGVEDSREPPLGWRVKRHFTIERRKNGAANESCAAQTRQNRSAKPLHRYAPAVDDCSFRTVDR